MPICYCSRCHRRQWQASRTVESHLLKDRRLLKSLVDANNPGTTQDLEDHLRNCIGKTCTSLEENKAITVSSSDSNVIASSHFENDITQADSEFTFDQNDLIEVEPANGLVGDSIGLDPDNSNPLDSDLDSAKQSTPAVPSNNALLNILCSADEDSGTGSDPDQDQDDITAHSTPPMSIQQIDEEMEDSEEEELIHNEDVPLHTHDDHAPAALISLKQRLLGDYTCPSSPPDAQYDGPRPLSQSEKLSLQHYSAWRTSNGTHVAYIEHKKVLESATGIEILSLFRVRKLAAALTGLHPRKIDMCPRSCIAYTGHYKDLDHCPHLSTNGLPCGEARFSSKRKPRAQVTILPVMETIRALFANADTSQQIRHRDSCLRAALDVVGNATQKYSDFGNSMVHRYQYQHLKLFQDPRDIALALSTDGAQLTMKKQSNTWLLILIVLNLPPDIRYKSGNVIINLATPGPNSPGDIESFLYPLFQEMASASAGLWMWDAVDSSYFCHRAYIVMGLGDMLGSAKISGMAGHIANKGDRFSEVEAAKSSLKKGSRALYYPMTPPQNSRYNPNRPSSYDLTNLPMRSEHDYWTAINELNSTISKQRRSKLTKETGISRMPLCAASEAFIHPTFFPLDPFHLFYENCMAHIWDIWMTHSKPSERVHIPATKAAVLGNMVSQAIKTLPPSFCGPIRDPYLKRQSQYKVYEWMGLLHWYIIPIGIELGLDASVLQNFSHLVSSIEFAMTIESRTEKEIGSLHASIRKFLVGFEALYVHDDPELISRCRLCIFQLIHVPIHIKWNGSVRLGSQATVERTIGEVGHRIRSRKSPFANLANIITEKELLRILKLYYPSLSINQQDVAVSNIPAQDKRPLPVIQVSQRLPIKKSEDNLVAPHITIIESFLKLDLSNPAIFLERWGKCRLSNGRMLRSSLSDRETSASRFYRWFEAYAGALESKTVIFGEALAFYRIVDMVDETTKATLVVYHPLTDITQPLGTLRGKWDRTKTKVLDVGCVVDIVGIWDHSGGNSDSTTYILRKHPALALLTADELGQKTEEDGVVIDDIDD